MKDLTLVFLDGEVVHFPNVETVLYDEYQTIEDIVQYAKTKYIVFVKNFKNTSEYYIDRLLEKAQLDFDVCFINYTIEMDGKVCSTEKLEEPEIQKKPYLGDYIWAYMWNCDKLWELLQSDDQSKEAVDRIFTYVNYIREPIYHHVPGNQRIVEDFIYVDEKEVVYEKNIVYVGDYCNGQFNGYITWLNQIGKCFGEEFPITILYDNIYEPTKKTFQKYFKVIQQEEDKNYVCNRLLVTYSTYYYPKNIIVLDENYVFIHGNMADYENARKYYYDNYTKYIAVSKIAADKAVGYFPTEHIDYILNPLRLDKRSISRHLTLVSAQRNDPIKKLERFHIIAEILDEENIPYTWNVFTDSSPREERVFNGLIYRPSVQNPLPYIKDADYYVQLSDSEAYCYSVVEALSLGTKVIVTPLECFQELDIDEKNSFVIPFSYFDPENKELLRDKVKEIYSQQDEKIDYKLNPEKFSDYTKLFEK